MKCSDRLSIFVIYENRADGNVYDFYDQLLPFVIGGDKILSNYTTGFTIALHGLCCAAECTCKEKQD